MSHPAPALIESRRRRVEQGGAAVVEQRTGNRRQPVFAPRRDPYPSARLRQGPVAPFHLGPNRETDNVSTAGSPAAGSCTASPACG